MSLTIDHAIFGNGYGIATPYHDGRFYWLVDTSKGRNAGKGRLYTWIGGFGAQLRSFEWRMPRPGTERVLSGYRFRPFNVSRRRFRYDVSWARVDLPREIDASNAALREMQERIGRL